MKEQPLTTILEQLFETTNLTMRGSFRTLFLQLSCAII